MHKLTRLSPRLCPKFWPAATPAQNATVAAAQVSKQSSMHRLQLADDRMLVEWLLLYDRRSAAQEQYLDLPAAWMPFATLSAFRSLRNGNINRCKRAGI